jgi:hypothetical protein
VFEKLFKWLSEKVWWLLGLPALDGLLAEPLSAWLNADWPKEAEFVRGRGSTPHWLALIFCAISFFVFKRTYNATASDDGVRRLQRRFGIGALVLLILSANFLYLDIPEEWGSITTLRIQFTYLTYLAGYIALGATLADKSAAAAAPVSP